MKPLRRYEDFYARSIMVGECECRFSTEKGLVLHTDVVCSLNNYWCCCRGVSVNDLLAADYVAIWVNRLVCTVDCMFWVRQWCEYFVHNFDSSKRSTTCLGMVRSHSCYWLTHVANKIFGEYWLVFTDETVGQLPRHIVSSYEAFNSRNLPRSRNINRNNSCIWVRRTQGRAPQHVLCM